MTSHLANYIEEESAVYMAPEALAERGEAGEQAFALIQPIAQGFRTVEAEDFTRTRLRVAGVGKAGDDASGFVEEGQRLLVIDPFESGGGVAFGLAFMHGEVLAFGFALGFNDADGFLVDEQHVVGRADVSRPFAHGLPDAGGEVDFLLHTTQPAARSCASMRSRACCSGFWFSVIRAGLPRQSGHHNRGHRLTR